MRNTWYRFQSEEKKVTMICEPSLSGSHVEESILLIVFLDGDIVDSDIDRIMFVNI